MSNRDAGKCCTVLHKNGSSGNLVESMGGAVGAVGDALLAPEPCPRPRPAGGPGPLGSNVRPSPRDGMSAKPRQRRVLPIRFEPQLFVPYP